MCHLNPLGRASLLLLALDGAPAVAQQYQYERPVDRAPTEQAIGEGYVTPQVQHPRPRAVFWQVADVVLLAIALGASAWLALWRRQRGGLVAVSVVSLAYFGFYREGCICPIGATQHVALALVDPRYAVPYYVIAIFVLPLAAALLVGRVSAQGSARSGRSRSSLPCEPSRCRRSWTRRSAASSGPTSGSPSTTPCSPQRSGIF